MQAFLYNMVLLHTHTYTHTHTERERERENALGRCTVDSFPSIPLWHDHFSVCPYSHAADDLEKHILWECRVWACVLDPHTSHVFALLQLRCQNCLLFQFGPLALK